MSKIYSDLLPALKEELKNTLDANIKESSGVPMAPAERKEMARVALDILWRMARGEYPGYDLRPTLGAVLAALNNPDMSLEAMEILGRLPGQEPQTRLTAIVLNLGQGKLRVPAAIELNRHIQKFGLMLDKAQAVGLKEAYRNADDDPALRTQLAALIGSLQSSSRLTGARLLEFRPDPPTLPSEKKKNKTD